MAQHGLDCNIFHLWEKYWKRIPEFNVNLMQLMISDNCDLNSPKLGLIIDQMRGDT